MNDENKKVNIALCVCCNVNKYYCYGKSCPPHLLKVYIMGINKQYSLKETLSVSMIKSKILKKKISIIIFLLNMGQDNILFA